MNSLRPRPTSSRTFVTALAVASISLIGACSGGSSGSTDTAVASVASVPGTATPAGSPRATTVTRPLIRLDSTPDEVQHLYDTYEKCLQDHGLPPKSRRGTGALTSKEKQALTACAAKEPEDYQEREKREHPAEFKDHQRIQIACMREHGLAIETDADGWGYTNPARDMGSAWDTKCERKAFG